jgi:hypothetical protein
MRFLRFGCLGLVVLFGFFAIISTLTAPSGGGGDTGGGNTPSTPKPTPQAEKPPPEKPPPDKDTLTIYITGDGEGPYKVWINKGAGFSTDRIWTRKGTLGSGEDEYRVDITKLKPRTELSIEGKKTSGWEGNISLVVKAGDKFVGCYDDDTTDVALSEVYVQWAVGEKPGDTAGVCRSQLWWY